LRDFDLGHRLEHLLQTPGLAPGDLAEAEDQIRRATLTVVAKGVEGQCTATRSGVTRSPTGVSARSSSEKNRAAASNTTWRSCRQPGQKRKQSVAAGTRAAR
jgi:hypothetical protein